MGKIKSRIFLIPLTLILSLGGERKIEAQTPKVLLGIDVLEQVNFAPLQGKKVGLVTNDAATDSRGRRTLDVLKNAPNVTLAAVFSPEHGLSAHEPAGQAVESQTNEDLPVYSLYGKTLRPDPSALKGLDALVLDLQDSGVRYYTYSTTMAYCLEAAAQAGIEFIVLDRPDPITGDIVEGSILEAGIRDFTAYLRVPLRHGLTMGELARFHNKDRHLNARLAVIEMKGWKRTMWWEDTRLPFTPPSPNIRTPTSALLYAGLGCFEATNVSVGRGTEHPFEVFGAPWLDASRLVKELKKARLTGVKFKTTRFQPASDLYAGERCQGVRVVVTNRALARPVDIFVYAFLLIARLEPAKFQPRWDEVAKMTGSRMLEKAVQSGMEPDPVWLSYRRSARIFEEKNGEVRLYGK